MTSWAEGQMTRGRESSLNSSNSEIGNMTPIGIPLSNLRPGQRGTILRIGGNRTVRRRYMEMGFVRGEDVLVERVAPLGDPIEYLIKGYHLSLRHADAGHIMVQVNDEHSS